MSEGKKQVKVDIVVYGATGFTGARIAKYLARTQIENKRSSKNVITFALAGREESKLRAVRKSIADEIDASLDNDEVIPIIVAKLNSGPGKKLPTLDNDALDRVCQSTRLIISAVGPYRFFGEEVVHAAVKAGIVYLVGGEKRSKSLAESFLCSIGCDR